jgi:hypothetical protein
MSLSPTTNQLEHNKFVENSEGNTAVRTTIDPVSSISISNMIPAVETGLATLGRALKSGRVRKGYRWESV